MGKINWTSLWKAAIIIVLAALMDVIVIVISNLDNPILIVFTVVLAFLVSLAVVQVVWFGIEKAALRFKRQQKKSRLRHWFELPKENDLRLWIQNPERAKPAYVEYFYENFADIRRRRYIDSDSRRLKLKLTSDSSGMPTALYRTTLTSNDTREIKVSYDYNGKIALYLGDDVPLYGFEDGRYEYTLKCLIDKKSVIFFSVWLIIKEGVLVEIRDKL